MALAEEIRALRDRVLAEFDSAHDYYTDTKIAWRLVHKIIAAGHKFTIRNPTTGTVRTQTDLADKARRYVAEQLTEATFQQFISTFENFFFDLLRCWLTTYPQSLGGKQVDFKTVLESPDKETVTQLVVNETAPRWERQKTKAPLVAGGPQQLAATRTISSLFKSMSEKAAARRATLFLPSATAGAYGSREPARKSAGLRLHAPARRTGGRTTGGRGPIDRPGAGRGCPSER